MARQCHEIECFQYLNTKTCSLHKNTTMLSNLNNFYHDAHTFPRRTRTPGALTVLDSIDWQISAEDKVWVDVSLVSIDF